MNKISKKVIAIVGPTASGKSSLGIKLAKKFDGEIISVDSRQVYKFMDIGTAKVEGKIDETQSLVINVDGKKKKIYPFISEGVNHWMIDIVDPRQDFLTAAEFQDMTYQIIFKLLSKGKVPFLVGGTGLYMDAVLKGYNFPKTSFSLRKELENFTNKELLKELKKVDPEGYKKIDKKNHRRILRALESYLVNQKSHFNYKNEKPDFEHITIGIDAPRNILYKKIDDRVDQWLEEGLLEEVNKLYSLGITHKKLCDFGLEYKSASMYIQDETTHEQMIHNLKYKTHAYARRQSTWYRKNTKIVWVKYGKSLLEKSKKIIEEFLLK